MTEHEIESRWDGREVHTSEKSVFADGEVEMQGIPPMVLSVLTADKIKPEVITVVHRKTGLPPGQTIKLEYWTGDDEKCLAEIKKRLKEYGYTPCIIEIDDLEEDIENARILMGDDPKLAIIFQPEREVEEVTEDRRATFEQLSLLLDES